MAQASCLARDLSMVRRFQRFAVFHLASGQTSVLCNREKILAANGGHRAAWSKQTQCGTRWTCLCCGGSMVGKGRSLICMGGSLTGLSLTLHGQRLSLSIHSPDTHFSAALTAIGALFCPLIMMSGTRHRPTSCSPITINQRSAFTDTYKQTTRTPRKPPTASTRATTPRLRRAFQSRRQMATLSTRWMPRPSICASAGIISPERHGRASCPCVVRSTRIPVSD